MPRYTTFCLIISRFHFLADVNYIKIYNIICCEQSMCKFLFDSFSFLVTRNFSYCLVVDFSEKTKMNVYVKYLFNSFEVQDIDWVINVKIIMSV